MPDVNPAALRERHLAAERWEKVRAAYHLLKRNDLSTSRKHERMARDHAQSARNIEHGMRKAKCS